MLFLDLSRQIDILSLAVKVLLLLFSSDFNYESNDPGCNLDYKITMFGICQVGLVSFDVGSDCYQAYVYHQQKHYYWSSSTLSLMFVPLITSSLTEVLSFLFKSCQGTADQWSWKDSFFSVAKHFPLVQPFVHLSTFLKLKNAKDEMIKAKTFYSNFKLEDVNDLNRDYYREQIDIAAQKYKGSSATYTKTMTNFQDLKLYEAFGEAAPQAVLQFAIILQLGYISPVQILTIATSLFSFSHASTEIFLMMKTKQNEVKNSTWRQTFVLTLPAMLVVVVPRILSLSLITAYSKEYSLLFMGLFILTNILVNSSCFKNDPVQVFLGALTNVFAPCIVICEGSRFFKRSGIASSIVHIIGQLALILLVICNVIAPCPDTKIHAPMLHCYMYEDVDDNFYMQRCPVLLNETSCSKDNFQVSFNTTDCGDILPIEFSIEGNHVTVCNGFLWWLPLAITCFCLIMFHLIGCVVITKYLSKILDPIIMLMMSTSKCCSIFNCFVPAWNEEEKEILPVIQEFLQKPSLTNLKGASIKLQELSRKPLIELSINHGYIEIIRIIVDDLKVPVIQGIVKTSFQCGNNKTTKMLLKKFDQRSIHGDLVLTFYIQSGFS